MDGRKLGLVIGLLSAGLFADFQTGQAVPLMNGDPVGPNYTIESIDAGVAVDFTATAPNAGNSNTIGKLTVTMSHSSLVFLGFMLHENAVAAMSSAANGGLRLLMDVVDTNGMTLSWVDYHIETQDNAEDVNAIRALLRPNEGLHLIEAHFHTPDNFASNPLVLKSSGDNEPELDFGLGSPVDPGKKFMASNILLHERDFAGFQRGFRVQNIPTVPEPTSLALTVLGILGVLGGGRRWRSMRGARRPTSV